MRRLRQRHSNMKWKAVIAIFLGMTAICEAAPTSASPTGSGKLPGRSTGPLPRRSPDQEVGSPSELAWQAWLLVDAQTGAHSGLDSGSLLRRITPKSVFVAPLYEACAEGYHADNMGRCVKDTVKFDRQAHFDFLLQRLNLRFRNGSSPGTNDDNPQSAAATGPLQLNIPLGIVGSQMTKPEQEETEDSMEVPMMVPSQGGTGDGFKNEKEAIVTVYEINNETKSERNTFFLGNSTKSNHSSSLSDVVVPVAEFIEDANQTFSDVVDYKIPIGLKSLFNESDLEAKGSAIRKNCTKPNSTESVSPTVVLFLSPTKLPLDASTPNMNELEFAHNSSAGHILVKMENVTDNSTEKEIISVSVPVSTVEALKIPPTPAAGEESKNESVSQAMPQGEILHNAGDIFDSVSNNNSEQVSILSPEQDEEYVDSVDTTEKTPEDSTEVDDEILKHGEAGMSFPMGNPEKVRLDEVSGTMDTDYKKSVIRVKDYSIPERMNSPAKVPSAPNLPAISHNNASQLGNNAANEESTSNVSSEVSISGDVILETTLLDLNTDKASSVNTTTPVAANFRDVAARDEFKELFEAERDLESEPEVVFSPQDGHGAVQTKIHGKKRAEEPGRPDVQHPGSGQQENRRPSFDRPALPVNRLYPHQSYSESLLYDPHPHDRLYPDEDEGVMPEIHSIDEQASFNREVVAMPDTNVENYFKPSETDRSNGFKPSIGYNSNQDYVRFPDERSVASRIPNYIRFPSEEANSIHTPNYKDRPSYAEDNSYSSTSTKSSVPIHQKQSYYWLPAAGGAYQQNQQNQRQQTIQQQPPPPQQKQRPMLLRFWKRMPLMPPSIYQPSFPTQSSPDERTRGPHLPLQSQVLPHQMNFYKEMSSQDVNRVFAQKFRAPTGG